MNDELLSAAPSRAERYRQIIGAFARHGIAAGGASPAVQAQQVRLACEELGPTFIKLGQMLATRGDLLSADFRDELLKLQDDATPVGGDYITLTVEDELGESISKLFLSFDPKPLASASSDKSMLRRYRTDAKSSSIRKPNVREFVERDLDILMQLASSSEKYFPYLREYDVRGMVENFGDTIRAEMDYRREARNIEMFREILAAENGVDLPEVVLQYSTSSVLTLTRLQGTKTSTSMPQSRMAREEAAGRLATVVLQPALESGVFHADPHGGNILVREDGRISVVDFGMVGRLTDELRRRVADLFMALSKDDVERVVDRLMSIAPPSHPVDRTTIVQQVARLTQRHMHDAIDRISFGGALTDLIDLVREQGLRLPMAVTLLFRSIAMSEGTILELAPQRSMADFLDKIANHVAASRLSPGEWAERTQASAVEAAELAIELPRRADRVLSEIERGNLRVWARLEDFEPLVSRFERMVERANASMIAAACIVAITVLFLAYHPEGGRPVATTIIWIASVIAVLWVARTAWATLRRRD
ncbi:MAG: AarF/UbiB family protein [Candidatus Eremiobacteraeota bacterium]|nr:AarF/UbiB family protein [Candidatus Eremiobacteraeota bacterium]